MSIFDIFSFIVGPEKPVFLRTVQNGRIIRRQHVGYARDMHHAMMLGFAAGMTYHSWLTIQNTRNAFVLVQS